MSQILGAVLVTLLVGTILLREAVGSGLAPSLQHRQRALNTGIVVLGVSFLTSVAIHLATL